MVGFGEIHPEDVAVPDGAPLSDDVTTMLTSCQVEVDDEPQPLSAERVQELLDFCAEVPLPQIMGALRAVSEREPDLEGTALRDAVGETVGEPGWAVQDDLADALAARWNLREIENAVQLFGQRARFKVIVAERCCPACQRLYGTEGEEHSFEVGALAPHRTNMGLPLKEWVPTIPPLHRGCTCGVVLDSDWLIREITNPSSTRSG